MEPEKEHPSLNDEQQAAAYCSGNAVVAAGAGSGKTMVLANRFAWLVTDPKKKYRVREILTLTFTKKATAQMYRRIYQLLTDIAGEGGERGRLAKQALDEFAQARIQTLDSYSASIVRQAAHRYGINPDFAINENRCRNFALEEALPFLIANRSHPAIRCLYNKKDPMSIAKNVFAAALLNNTCIDSVLNPEQGINAQCAIISGEWEKQCAVIGAQLSRLAEIYAENEKCHPDLGPLVHQYNTGNAVFPEAQELRGFFDQLVKQPHDTIIAWADKQALKKRIIDTLEFLSALCHLDLRRGTPQKNPAKEIIKELKALFGTFSSLAMFCIQAGFICSALSLLHTVQCRYLNRKRTEGVLTFNDVARLSRKILLEQYDIRQSEKESFKAIMIDEFQDNNELQKDLLFLLAEKMEKTSDTVPTASDIYPDKLFFVGDEKQSIFRFRGADVSVFRKLKTELGGKALPLKTNYRSAPLLIGAFNAIFGGSAFSPDGKCAPAGNPAVFAPNTPHSDSAELSALPLFEASYTPLEAGKKNSDPADGKLTLCILDKKDTSNFSEMETNQQTSQIDVPVDPVEVEARYIAERIHSLLQEKTGDGKPKYQPDDIAILFRSRKPQRLFEKHLMLLSIPFTCEDLSDFFYGGPVDDIMSVLRLAAYRMDRAAYAQMLRSPFAGISLPGLAICLSGDPASFKPFSNETLPLLSDEDKKRYAHGQGVYQKIFDKACTDSICSLISELWYGEGYRYETEWNPETASFRDLYDYLFHLAAQADEENQGLAAFTDSMQLLYKTGERLNDIEIPLERSGAIRLMTIHKSKGLEFPVVFLCCCSRTSGNDSKGDIFDTDDAGITINPIIPAECRNIKGIKTNYFWERSLAVERRKRTAELRRLLYVGMTRAEQELYLSGCLNIGGKENGNTSDDNFLLNVKQYVDDRVTRAALTAQAGKNSIVGDTILDNDTFFGLCLPAFTSAKEPFFSLEKIPVYSEEYLRNSEQHGSRFSNDQKGLNDFFNAVEPYYRCGEDAIIETPVVPKRHFAPTYLNEDNNALQGKYPISSEYSGVDAADVFAKVDRLLNRYSSQGGEDNEKFNSGGFGTIAHLCVEALLSNQEAVIPPKLAGFLTPADADAFLEAGKELALRFSHSPLGIIASSSKERRSEFQFRSIVNEIFINGTIDLVFEDEKTVYVVDFKTDTQEMPNLHLSQMACYYRAASDLFAVPANKECSIWLYYLRSGHAVEVTMQTRNIMLTECEKQMVE